MPKGLRVSPEQVVVTLRQIEVQVAQGKSPRWPARRQACPNRATSGGARSMAGFSSTRRAG